MAGISDNEASIVDDFSSCSDDAHVAKQRLRRAYKRKTGTTLDWLEVRRLCRSGLLPEEVLPFYARKQFEEGGEVMTDTEAVERAKVLAERERLLGMQVDACAAAQSPTMNPDDVLLYTIADIRAVTGVGSSPMLSKLADAIKERMEAIRAETVEECAAAAAQSCWRHEGEDAYSKGMDQGARHQATACYEAIRSLKQVKE